MIRKGEPWGRPAQDPPDREVEGGDAALATAAREAARTVAGTLFRFRPDATSDLARAVGLGPDAGAAVTTEVALDVLQFGDDWAVNAVILGPPPDRLGWAHRSVTVRVIVDGQTWLDGPATTVVCATGQFLRGADLAPRGHPGDGRAELQGYALRRGERAAMRRRLPEGAHVPHPRIKQRTGRNVEVHASRPLALEVDGEARGRVTELTIDLVPGAYRLLV